MEEQKKVRNNFFLFTSAISQDSKTHCSASVWKETTRTAILVGRASRESPVTGDCDVGREGERMWCRVMGCWYRQHAVLEGAVPCCAAKGRISPAYRLPSLSPQPELDAGGRGTVPSIAMQHQQRCRCRSRRIRLGVCVCVEGWGGVTSQKKIFFTFPSFRSCKLANACMIGVGTARPAVRMRRGTNPVA